MKRILLIVVLCLCFFCFAGCSKIDKLNENAYSIDGFLAASMNYDKYTSPDSVNDLKGSLIYVDGEVVNQIDGNSILDDGSDIPMLVVVIEQEDGNEWAVIMPSEHLPEIEGQEIRAFGTYQEYSKTLNLPMITLVNSEAKLQVKSKTGKHETVYNYQDFVLEYAMSNTGNSETTAQLTQTPTPASDSTVTAKGKNAETEKEVLLYEDSNVKIYFSRITTKGVEFLVENKTDLNITIQADTVSVNGMSTDSILMSDDVAPQSKGKVVAECDDFSTNTVVETVGGQLRIIDFSKTWEPHIYDAKFVNVPIE